MNYAIKALKDALRLQRRNERVEARMIDENHPLMLIPYHKRATTLRRDAARRRIADLEKAIEILSAPYLAYEVAKIDADKEKP